MNFTQFLPKIIYLTAFYFYEVFICSPFILGYMHILSIMTLKLGMALFQIAFITDQFSAKGLIIVVQIG